MMKDQHKTLAGQILTTIDKYVASNWQTMTCAELSQIYSELFYELKKFRGNSSGFTGFSELLVFRFLFHLLGGNFSKVGENQDTYRFKKGSVEISQALKPQSGVNYKPDVLIEQNSRTIAAIEIKLYPTGAIKTITQAFSRLEELCGSNQDNYCGLLLIFDGVSTNLKRQIDKLASDNPWFKALVLKDNPLSFKQALSDSLNLSRITG